TCHVELRAAGSPGQIFDGMSIAITGNEVHRAELALTAKQMVDQAHLLEEVTPVEGRHDAQARDHVSYGHVGGGLALVLGTDEVVSRGATRGEPLVEPACRRSRRRVLVAQPLGESHGERRVRWPVAARSERLRIPGQT